MQIHMSQSYYLLFFVLLDINIAGISETDWPNYITR